MFLAWNEVKNNKLRFTLIVGVLMLVAYLVFFLSGLASGLEQLNREAVDKWEAEGIVLTEESNVTIDQSNFSMDDVNVEGIEESAALGQLRATASVGETQADVAIFGIDEEEFIMPNVTEGEAFQEEGEVIADDSIQADGFELGDELALSSSDETLTIVGFTDNSKFSAAPVLYTSLETYKQVKFGERAGEMEEQINALVVRTDNLEGVSVNDDLQVVKSETFIENLPGYTAQKLTLTLMIYFLFIISAVILAIFLYVLTIQKISIFGVMKAQGISNSYLARSVIAQTFILAFAGTLIGFILTVITGLFLPEAVPVSFNYLEMLVYGIVLVLMSVVGALFSIRTIVKIDPLKAIGG